MTPVSCVIIFHPTSDVFLPSGHCFSPSGMSMVLHRFLTRVGLDVCPRGCIPKCGHREVADEGFPPEGGWGVDVCPTLFFKVQSDPGYI